MSRTRAKYRTLAIDERTTIADMAENVRIFMADSQIWFGALLALLDSYFFFTNRLGATAFILSSIGAFICIRVWSVHGKGVPLLPTMALQHLVAYGMPVVASNETLKEYTSDQFTQAGVEVLVFLAVMTVSWYGFMQIFSACKPVSYTLSFVRRGGFAVFRKLGLILIGFTTIYEVAYSAGMLNPMFDALPQGSLPIFVGLVGAASMCGFFIGALGVGSGTIERSFKILFWTAFIVQCVVTAATLLLSSMTVYVASVMIGLFWSSGRFPWKFVVITLTILSFFNLSKHEMRSRFWDPTTGEMSNYTLSELPSIYTDWFDASSTMMFDSGQETRKEKDSKQTLAERVNNLSNLLFVIDAMQNQHIEPLYGKTYEIIPPLLIPRYFWPEKPRTHEGQIILNVHFGRQDLESTFTTYIAWGLIPEAYGNFGPYLGSIILGAAMGMFIAWIERATQNKAVLSLEGFALFALFLGMATSYEMVASVLVTSVFQSIVSICLAVAPFVDRTVHKKEQPT